MCSTQQPRTWLQKNSQWPEKPLLVSRSVIAYPHKEAVFQLVKRLYLAAPREKRVDVHKSADNKRDVQTIARAEEDNVRNGKIRVLPRMELVLVSERTRAKQVGK